MPQASEIGHMNTNTSSPKKTRLLALAWFATLLPAVSFAYLTWETVGLERQRKVAEQGLTELATERAELEALKDSLTAEIDSQRAVIRQQDDAIKEQERNTEHYRGLANLTVQYYREADREVIDRAFEHLGFKLAVKRGESALVPGEPNTIAFGERASL